MKIMDLNEATPRTRESSGPGGILVFSERRKLAGAFTDWAEQNGVSCAPESVITYLLSEGLLDVQKCRRLISNRKKGT